MLLTDEHPSKFDERQIEVDTTSNEKTYIYVIYVKPTEMQ